MISCKRATEMMSRALEEPLSVEEEQALKVHNFICEFCRQFERQIALFRGVLKRFGSSASGSTAAESADQPAETDCCMSQAAKERVKEALKDLDH